MVMSQYNVGHTYAKGGSPEFGLEVQVRGLHSLTSQLNLSALYGIGGARRGCVAHVKGV
jgi:hypothetical protein